VSGLSCLTAINLKIYLRVFGLKGERRSDARKRRWRKETGRSEEKVEKGDRTLGREGRERRPDARKRR
jgi:hypothetical protein